MQLSLTKLPWYGQLGAFVVLALGIVGAFVYYYEMPAREELATRQTQLDALRAEIQRGLTTANKLARVPRPGRRPRRAPEQSARDSAR